MYVPSVSLFCVFIWCLSLVPVLCMCYVAFSFVRVIVFVCVVTLLFLLYYSFVSFLCSFDFRVCVSFVFVIACLPVVSFLLFVSFVALCCVSLL